MNEKEWVECVYREYFHLFLSIGVRSYGLSVDTAKEKLQETFVNVWKNRDVIQNASESGVRGYAIRTFRNICINHLRRKSPFVEASSAGREDTDENEAVILSYTDERSHPLFEMLLIEELRLQEKVIGMLPECYREPVRLSLNGLKSSEIAQKTGLKMTELNNYKYRGLKQYEKRIHQLDPLRKET